MKKVILLFAALVFALAMSAQAERAIPQELTEIPQDYYGEASEPGTLEDLYYDTWESFSYEEHTNPLQKHAVVYLPYGYDANQPYNIIYLMHGGWGTEERTLGAVGNPSSFKRVVDHAIQNGDMRPAIIVCPTYNNTNLNGLDSNSFSLAMRLTDNYHNELVNDLMPALEGKYSTYAEDITPEGLAASRDHRAFIGYSMGSVTTWRTFEYCLDYFRYFMPMSCGTTLDDAAIFGGAKGHNPKDYFVWVFTGTADFAYGYDEARVAKMRQSPYFIESDTEDGGNFAYRVKEGYDHGPVAEAEYTYNGMMWLWNHE